MAYLLNVVKVDQYQLKDDKVRLCLNCTLGCFFVNGFPMPHTSPDKSGKKLGYENSNEKPSKEFAETNLVGWKKKAALMQEEGGN
jgi:hypothetical protein